MVSCVQRALVSCYQPADGLGTIVSITDNLLGCNIAGCNPQQHSHAYGQTDGRKTGRLYRTLLKQVRQK